MKVPAFSNPRNYPASARRNRKPLSHTRPTKQQEWLMPVTFKCGHGGYQKTQVCTDSGEKRIREECLQRSCGLCAESYLESHSILEREKIDRAIAGEYERKARRYGDTIYREE